GRREAALPGGRVPQGCRRVYAADGEAFAVGAEGWTAPLPVEREAVLPGTQIPHLHGLVFAPGGKAFAVGADADAKEVLAWCLPREARLAGGGVPHLDLRGPPLADEAFAVRGKKGPAEQTRLGDEDRPAGGGVPHPQCPVEARAGEAFAIGTEVEARHTVRVPAEGQVGLGEQAPKVRVLPVAEVPATGIQQVAGGGGVALLPV